MYNSYFKLKRNKQIFCKADLLCWSRSSTANHQQTLHDLDRLCGKRCALVHCWIIWSMHSLVWLVLISLHVFLQIAFTTICLLLKVTHNAGYLVHKLKFQFWKNELPLLQLTHLIYHLQSHLLLGWNKAMVPFW